MWTDLVGTHAAFCKRNLVEALEQNKRSPSKLNGDGVKVSLLVASGGEKGAFGISELRFLSFFSAHDR